MHQEHDDLTLSRDMVKDRIKQGKLDVFEDKIFIKHLTKEIKSIHPDIQVIFYKEQKMVCFIWRGIIFYKVLLDEYNTETIPPKEHKQIALKSFIALVKNLINGIDKLTIYNNMKNFNARSGKQL